MKKVYHINGDQIKFKTPYRYFSVCCDCGLTHLNIFDKEKNKVIWTVYRDDYRTNQIRKDMGKKKK